MTPRCPRIAASAALAVTALTCAAAQPAAAAPSWLAPAPFELGSAPEVRQAELGFGAGRELYAVDPPTGSTQPIRVYARDAGAGSGSTPTPQTSFASVTGGTVAAARFAVAPNGAAVLAWNDASATQGGPALMRATYRGPDGAWQQPVTVASGVTSGASLPGENPPFSPHVAIGADGTAVVVAEHGEDPTQGELQWDARIDAIVQRPGAGGWSGSVRLSAQDRSASSVSVAVAGNGEVTVAWADRYGVGGTDSEDDDDHTAVARRWVPSNGIWDATQDVAHAGPTDDADGVQLGVADDGAAVLAYTRIARGAITTVAALRAPGAGGFAVPRLVATGRDDTTPLAAAVAPDGVATVLWRAPSVTNGADAGIGATRAAADGAWSAPRLLSGYPEQDSVGAIAFSGRDTVLGWSAFGGAEQVVQGARWQAGTAAPEPTRDLDAQNGFVRLQQLVGDGEGGVVALFDRADGLRTAVFDAGAPNLRAADVPQIVAAQQPATFSADVLDRWSPLAGAPSWEFSEPGAATGAGGSAGTGGPGTGAPGAGQPGGPTVSTGASTTHVFTTPGTATVTLRARDALGNALGRSFAVQVVAPTSGAGGGGAGGGASGGTGDGGTPTGRRPAASRVAFARPACPRKLRLAKPRVAARRRCARWLGTTAAWRTIRGSASGTRRIELRFVEPVAAGGGSGGGAGRGGADRSGAGSKTPTRVRGAKSPARPLTTRTIVRRAAVRRGAWSVKSPTLSASRVTLRLRALDARGKPVGRASVKKLWLR